MGVKNVFVIKYMDMVYSFDLLYNELLFLLFKVEIEIIVIFKKIIIVSCVFLELKGVIIKLFNIMFFIDII